jgi:hypothetical protein
MHNLILAHIGLLGLCPCKSGVTVGSRPDSDLSPSLAWGRRRPDKWSACQRAKGGGEGKQAVRPKLGRGEAADWAAWREGERKRMGRWAGPSGREKGRRMARLGWAARRKRERKKKEGVGRV